MKNIYEILSKFGIEVPEDKKDDFEKAVNENYKTVKEVEGLKDKLSKAEGERDNYRSQYDTDIAQRDKDLKDLQVKLEEAGQSKDKLGSLQTDLSDLQKQYDTDKANWEKQLLDQQYAFSLSEQARDIKFSSKAAQKVFIDELTANPLQLKDGKILGFSDYVDAYKESNPDSFLADNDEGGNTPFFSSKSGKKDNDGDNSSDNHQETKQTPIIW